MKLVQFVSFVSLCVTSIAVNPAGLRASAVGVQSKPIDIDLVVQSIADHLWTNDKDLSLTTQSFVIFGSYPAAVKAYEEEGLVLPYNDIDVYYGTTDCKGGMTVVYKPNIIPGNDVEVNLVGKCDFSEDLEVHSDVDINAVTVALKVVPTTSDSGTLTPAIDSWSVSPLFRDFLQTQTLSITDTGLHNRPASALVRLAAKSQQLKMAYALPTNQTVLEESFHGAPLSKLYKTRLDNLDEDSKKKFYNVFDVHEAEKPNWYRVGLKGVPLPTKMRALQSRNPYGNDGEGGGGCFSKTARAHVKGKGLIPMMNLNVGDEILTGNGRYEPIYAWAHRAPAISASYLQMKTSAGNKLEVTPEHLIYVKSKADPVRADQIAVGDLFVGADGDVSVTCIRTVKRKGLFAPLTSDGTIVVEGIKSSCYIWTGATPVDQHRLVHTTLAPFRWLCSGASFGFCHSYTERGMPHFVDYGLQLAAWFDTFEANSFVKYILLTAYLVIVGAMRVVEHALDKSVAFWLPAAFFAFGLAGVASRSGLSFSVRKQKQV